MPRLALAAACGLFLLPAAADAGHGRHNQTQCCVPVQTCTPVQQAAAYQPAATYQSATPQPAVQQVAGQQSAGQQLATAEPGQAYKYLPIDQIPPGTPYVPYYGDAGAGAEPVPGQIYTFRQDENLPNNPNAFVPAYSSATGGTVALNPDYGTPRAAALQNVGGTPSYDGGMMQGGSFQGMQGGSFQGMQGGGMMQGGSFQGTRGGSMQGPQGSVYGGGGFPGLQSGALQGPAMPGSN